MCEQDFAKFSAYLAGIAMTFDKTLEPEQINIYFEVLKDEFATFGDFKAAADSLLKTWSFGYMPKPAHFIQATQVDLDLIAEQAYASAKTAAIRYGVYKNIEFEDKAIETTIATLFGSFKEFHDRVAYIDSDDTWVKKEFIQTYKAVVRNGALKPIKLIGYLQSEFKDPVVVGADYRPPLLGVRAQQPAIPQKLAGHLECYRKVG